MTKHVNIFAVLLALPLVSAAIPVMGQTVNVTFTANTSTNLDTLGERGVVQIRGAILGSANGQTGEGDILPGGGNISWSSASSLVLSNIGGDYWQGTFELTVGDTLTYKYWTDHASLSGGGTKPDGGWEGPFNDTQNVSRDTRILIVGPSDTTLQTQYYQPGGGSDPKDEFTPPFATKADTVAIYFRVNMAGIEEAGLFDAASNGPVGVRGDGGTSGGTIDWGETRVLLTREEVLDSGENVSSFWSGTAYVDKDSIAVRSIQAYKFYVENDGGIAWEDNLSDNRKFTYTANLVANMDTTLHWVYFDDREPTGLPPVDPVDSQITFRVSTEALETLGLFDRGIGDQIKVIGAKGWGRPDEFIDLAFVPALQEWATTEPFSVIPETEIRYKYFVLFDTSRVDPSSPNFIPNLKIQGVNDNNEDSGWEEPSVTGGSDRSFIYANAATQAPAGDFGFDRQFFNSVPANAGIPHGVAVTFNVDMAPATDAAANTLTLFRPGVDSVYIQPDGSLLALSQGFETVGDQVVLLEDPDGDMIYTGTWDIKDRAWYQIGFVIAYGNTADGFNTNGGGTVAGRRYYQFIQPTSVGEDGSTTWPTEFTLATIAWVERNLPFETPPDLSQPTSVSGPRENLPNTFALNPNYPNPFNPTTNIEYSIASSSEVKIQVFNLVGQLVNTLVDEKQRSGSYLVTWNGDNARGQAVSSGIYFIKMKAGDFNSVRKMTLLK